jgi:hypothetical protein
MPSRLRINLELSHLGRTTPLSRGHVWSATTLRFSSGILRSVASVGLLIRKKSEAASSGSPASARQAAGDTHVRRIAAVSNDNAFRSGALGEIRTPDPQFEGCVALVDPKVPMASKQDQQEHGRPLRKRPLIECASTPSLMELKNNVLSDKDCHNAGTTHRRSAMPDRPNQLRTKVDAWSDANRIGTLVRRKTARSCAQRRTRAEVFGGHSAIR